MRLVRDVFGVLLAVALAGCATPVSETLEEGSSSIESASENPDIETPAQIAAAHAKVAADFAVKHSLAPGNWSHLDPEHVVPENLLKEALVYFDANRESFPNQTYMTIVDFKRHSAKYRFFLVNLQDGSVERYHTTHGRGGDVDDDGFAEAFGNVPESQKSSLGFVRTAEVYSGAYGVSIRLDGLEATNSKIRDRAIVFHGWDKTIEANVKQGRSAGCVTLDYAVKDPVLQKIKEGSLMYVGLGTEK